MKKIRVIIIDDERAARDEVKRLLVSYPDIEIAAEARNADEADQVRQAALPRANATSPSVTGHEEILQTRAVRMGRHRRLNVQRQRQCIPPLAGRHPRFPPI